MQQRMVAEGDWCSAHQLSSTATAKDEAIHGGYQYHAEIHKQRNEHEATKPRYPTLHSVRYGTDYAAEQRGRVTTMPVKNSQPFENSRSQLPELYTVHYSHSSCANSPIRTIRTADRSKRSRRGLQSSKSAPDYTFALKQKKGRTEGSNDQKKGGRVDKKKKMQQRRNQRRERAKRSEEKKEAELRSKAKTIHKDSIGAALCIPAGALEPIKAPQKGNTQKRKITLSAAVDAKDLPPLPKGFIDIGPAVQITLNPVSRRILAPLTLSLAHSAQVIESSDGSGESILPPSPTHQRRSPEPSSPHAAGGFKIRILRKTRSGYEDVCTLSEATLAHETISFPISSAGIFRIVQSSRRVQRVTLRAYASSLELPKAGAEVPIRLVAHGATPDQHLVVEAEERTRRAHKSYWIGFHEVGRIDMVVQLGHDIVVYRPSNQNDKLFEGELSIPVLQHDPKSATTRMRWEGSPVYSDLSIQVPYRPHSDEPSDQPHEHIKKLLVYCCSNAEEHQKSICRCLEKKMEQQNDIGGSIELPIKVKLYNPEAKKRLKTAIFATVCGVMLNKEQVTTRMAGLQFEQTLNQLKANSEPVHKSTK